jgi:hypothetical protein
MVFLPLGNTPLNLSKSGKTWEDVSGKRSTVYVFQNRRLARIYGTNRQEVRMQYIIIRNLEFVHFTGLFFWPCHGSGG